MTKKDYELFANEIYNHGQWVDNKLSEYIIDLTCRVFEKDNPKFQRDKFKRACYEGKHIRKSI